MLIEPMMAKTEKVATIAASSGGLTMLAAFNDWSNEYAPTLTFLFGFGAFVTGMATLVYKIWAVRVDKQQRVRDRALEHKRIEHEERLAGLRDSEDWYSED